MHISKVNVFNYRLLNQTSVSCEKDLSLIIGKNNCGKTSFLSVLSKCIGNKSEVGNFDFNDFSTLFQKKLYKVVKGESAFQEEELTGIRVDFYIESEIVIEVQKRQNRRNPQSVISLSNKLRIDKLEQVPSEDENAPNMKDGKVKEGTIKFIYGDILSMDSIKKKEYFAGWDFSNPKETKELRLTHNLIASNAGFPKLMEIYDKDPFLKLKKEFIKYTPLYNFSIKNVIQGFLMYNKFANKKIRKKVILYDRLIIQRKNYNW